MEEKNENVILNISNMAAKRNIEINSNLKTKNDKNNKKHSNSKENNANILLSEENKIFKNRNNSSYHRNNKKKNLTNESIYPIKIKKMSKTDIIIKDEESKKNNYIAQHSTTEFTDSDIKNIKNKDFNNKKSKAKKSNEKYICKICKKEYNLKNSFQKHLLIHQKKKFICNICNSRFSVNSKLKRHLLIHSDVKEFKCPECDSAFNLKYNLKVHMRVHNNEKPYICGYPGCFAKFAQQNNLTTHTKIHNNNEKKEKNEMNIFLNFYNNIIKFNTKEKKFYEKLLELNKMALNE